MSRLPLSVSKEPQQLLLDTLSMTCEVRCGWLISISSKMRFPIDVFLSFPSTARFFTQKHENDIAYEVFPTSTCNSVHVFIISNFLRKDKTTKRPTQEIGFIHKETEWITFIFEVMHLKPHSQIGQTMKVIWGGQDRTHCPIQNGNCPNLQNWCNYGTPSLLCEDVLWKDVSLFIWYKSRWGGINGF